MTIHRASSRLTSGWTTRARLVAALVAVVAVVLIGGLIVAAFSTMEYPDERAADVAPSEATAGVTTGPTTGPTTPAARSGKAPAGPRRTPGKQGKPEKPGKPGKPADADHRRKGSGLAGRVEDLLGKRRLVLAEPSTGRVGSGLTLGALESAQAPVGGPVNGTVTVSVANVPNRTSASGFVTALRAVTADEEDFVLLNEISARSLDTMRAIAPGYDAYRDPVVDRTQGGSQSMNNAVMWRADRWNLVDGGRVKVVDDDRGYRQGAPFVWDRYATWTVLQRISDGAIVSVVSTHLPTNPVFYPAQPPGSSQSRVARYSQGMDRVTATVRTLARYGPVLMGGDMNSHAYQGSWTAAAKMSALGYGYVVDSGVMHLFHPSGVQVLAHREVAIPSDHPALVVALDLAGQGPVG